MGNCQAIDAAALVIQHPDGRLDRLYWSVSAGEVMRTNPGHYVSLIIPLPAPEEGESHDKPNKAVRFTRVKLLRPDDTLSLGHAYRLITTQEVMKVLRAKKYKKMKLQDPELAAQTEMAGEKPLQKCQQAYHENPQNPNVSLSLTSICDSGFLFLREAPILAGAVERAESSVFAAVTMEDVDRVGTPMYLR